jgi:Ca2+:H+ antiporter
MGFASLMLSLVSVIGFAKTLSPAIEQGVAALGAPRATVGIVLTVVTGGLTLGRGSTTALEGLIHLVLLGAYLAFSFVP